MTATPVLTAREVLVVLAQQVARCGKATVEVGGSIRFIVRPDGDWTLNLDAPGGSWSSGAHGDEADATVEVPTRHFADLLLNPDALKGLLAAGTIRVSGDVEKIDALGELLALMAEGA